MSRPVMAEVLRLYQPPQCGDGPCRDLFMDFVYCVVVPCSVTLLIFLLLVWLVFCKCKTCKCKKSKSFSPMSEQELETYHTIRRASASLRHMSQHRETPLMASRAGSTVTLERQQRRTQRTRPDSCYSAPGTLQRHPRQRPVDYSNGNPRDSRTSALCPDDTPGSGRSPRHRFSDQPSGLPPPPYNKAAGSGDPLVGAPVYMPGERGERVPSIAPYYQSTTTGDDSPSARHY